MVDHHIFSSLTERQKCLLKDNMLHGIKDPRSYLFENDVKLKHIYFIRKGTLMMGNNLGERHENYSFLTMKPTFIGIESLLISTNNEFAKTLSKVYYSKIDYSLFCHILIENSTFHNVIRTQIAERYNEVSNKYVQLHSAVQVHDRLKLFLFEILAKNKITNPDKDKIELYITHFEIAKYVKCTRQSVSAFMSEIRKEGIIDYDRKWICINNPEKLSEWNIK